MDHRDQQLGLVRALGPWQAASIVVGTIIGTGVFLKTAVMSQLGGSPVWVLAAWGAAGLLSLAGALTYAELGAMYPHAGGEYVFLRKGYKPVFGYLYAWNRFWVATPGSIAAYAVGSATFLSSAIDIDVLGGPRVVAISLIVVFTAVNCLNVRTGGWLQTVLTVMKVGMIAALAFGAVAAAKHGSWSGVTENAGFPGWSAFGAMILAALWAYDGWNNLPMAAGEVANPMRNVPRAIVGGVLAVLAIYAIVNTGYFYALPFGEVVTSSSTQFPNAPSVAAKTAATFLGDTTQALLATAMVISALSAMNGSMLTGARVPFAVAADGLAPKALAKLSPTTHVPVTAVLVQGVIAVIYALSSRFDQLTDAVVFASWVAYALNAGSVIMLRKRAPDHPRSFKVPGFPVVPIVFVVLATLLLVNTLWAAPYASALGISTTSIGAIVYFTVYRRKQLPETGAPVR